MAFLNALIAFVVTIGILVTVHEFGHFWVAKKLGIKVLRFSVGFGKILKSWKIGETQYTLCALPLGGFVKMLDENEGGVDPSERHRAFNTQTVYKRIAVVVAGPAANFILAIIIYTAIFVIGTHDIKPVVGVIKNDSIAQQAGLKTGDQLLSINTQDTPSVKEFSFAFVRAAQTSTMQIDVRSKTDNLKTLTLDLKEDFLANPEQGVERYLGFEFALPTLKPIINQVVNGSPASLVGIQSGDQILSANNNPINTWRDFVEVIKQNDGQAMQLSILRDKQTITRSLMPKNENGIPKIGVSVMAPEGYLDEWRVLVKKQPIDAFLSANVKTYQLTMLNLKMIQKMISGEASIKQISGPVSIADYAGKTASIGLISFLSFLALISIGLGLLNLLPIPLLDGGHLFFYLIEILKGSPVSQTFQQISIKVGLLVILSLTSVAMYNDFSRLLS
ncbi:MAG: RIP metalloprotease RseP [Gammaproteobacteria bacterium]|nr:MAG: RIP metalloprotease RseP [Gammaproteobacteria bacterium]